MASDGDLDFAVGRSQTRHQRISFEIGLNPAYGLRSRLRGLFENPGTMELIFEVRDAEEGGFYARALGHGIFTEAEDWDQLRVNVLEAVSLPFEGAATRPRLVQMQYVKDEQLPLEAA